MHRFFSPAKNISFNKIIINDEDCVHHIRDVLRLKINDEVIIFDTEGNEYICTIEELKDNITVGIKAKQGPGVEREEIKIIVACAIPKKSKMDEIIDKLTQLGVDRIIPLKTARVIVRLDKRKEAGRLERWRRIALSAAQQSQRKTLPVIEPIKNIREALLKSENYDLKLIPTLAGRRKTLKEIFRKIKPKNILVFIGPEGDFTDAEIKLAQEKGFIPVTLGDTVLRVDTAAIAVVSYLRLNGNH